jgi:hypothetical protein
MVLAFRGRAILLHAAEPVAAAFAAGPLLAHWTQTFMPAATGFVARSSRWSCPASSWTTAARSGPSPTR